MDRVRPIGVQVLDGQQKVINQSIKVRTVSTQREGREPEITGDPPSARQSLWENRGINNTPVPGRLS